MSTGAPAHSEADTAMSMRVLQERDDALKRVAELEALLREIDAKIIWGSAVRDGTGQALEERVESALGISVNR